MKNFRNLLIVPALLVIVFTIAVMPAVADRGSSSADNNSMSDSGSGASENSSHGMSSDATSSRDKAGPNDTSGSDSNPAADKPGSSETEQQTEDSYREKADSVINEMLSERHGRQSDGARTRKCQAAQHGLETKLTNMQKNAAKYKSLIDNVYSQALVYQQQNNLNPSNFSTLVSVANADQAKVAQSVGALNGLSVNLDCGSSSVANNVETFKLAAQQARGDLLAYRKAVIAVLQALESSKQ